MKCALGVLTGDAEAADLLQTCLASITTLDSSQHGRISCWVLALHSQSYVSLTPQLKEIQRRALVLAEQHYEQCLAAFLTLLYAKCYQMFDR